MLELERQGIAAADVHVERRGLVKYRGTDVALPVPWAVPEEMAAAFLELHHARYGFLMPGRALVLEAVAVEAVSAGGPAEADALPHTRRHGPAAGPTRPRAAARSRRASRGASSPAAAATRRRCTCAKTCRRPPPSRGRR